MGGWRERDGMLDFGVGGAGNVGMEGLNVGTELGNAGMYNQWCFYLLLACCPVGVVLSCG